MTNQDKNQVLANYARVAASKFISGMPLRIAEIEATVESVDDVYVVPIPGEPITVKGRSSNVVTFAICTLASYAWPQLRQDAPPPVCLCWGLGDAFDIRPSYTQVMHMPELKVPVIIAKRAGFEHSEFDQLCGPLFFIGVDPPTDKALLSSDLLRHGVDASAPQWVRDAWQATAAPTSHCKRGWS